MIFNIAETIHIYPRKKYIKRAKSYLDLIKNNKYSVISNKEASIRKFIHERVDGYYGRLLHF